MPSIASTWVEVAPETSKLAEGIRRAFRDIDPDVREAAKRWGREIEQGIGKPKVELEADTAKARAEMDEAARDRKSTIEVDVDQSKIGSVERGVSSAITQGGESGIAGMQPALLGVGATMLAGIASALSGLGGLIPGAALGAGGVVGTLVTGLDGVKDAYDAVNKAADQSGQDQADKAKEVTSAQRSLTDAVHDQATAQKDVSEAYKDARQQLDDLNLSLQGGKISEAQAYNNVLKARRDLAKGGFKDQLELNDAQLRVQSSEQSWQESKQRNVELQTKANDANSKGVENSDQVVAANERLRKTNEQVADAQAKLNDSQTKSSSAVRDAADAMAKLSPNAQGFVNTLMAMKPAFLELKNSVQDALFANLGPQFQALSTTYLPLLQNFMTSMATTMNQAFSQISQFLMQPQNLAVMQTVFDNLSKSFSVFMQAAQPATAAFLKFSEVGSSFLPQLGQMAVQAANAFNAFAQSGDLKQWIQTGMDALGELIKMFPTLMQMFRDLAPVGMATLQGLNSILTALAPAIAPLSNLLAALITNGLTPMLTMVAQVATTLVQALAPALTQWAQALGPIVAQVSGALMPVLQQLAPVLSQVATQLVTSMTQGLQQIAPYIGPIAQAFGNLLSALIPLIPQVVNLAVQMSPLIQLILPALIQAFLTFAPIMVDFLTKMTTLATNVMPPVIKGMGFVADAFKTGFNTIKDVVKSAWDFIKPIFDKITEFVANTPDWLKRLAGIPTSDPGSARGGGYVPKTPGASIPGAPASSGPSVGKGAGHLADWDKVAGKESSGNWGTNTGNGFHGGLQFTPGSWAAAGGLTYAPSAEQATPEQQKTVADKLLQMQGPGAWPATSAAHPDWFTAPAATAPSSTPPAVSAPSSAAPGDAALLSQVPAGSYSQPGSNNWDLTKGLGDCSSAVEDLVNLLDGKSTAGRSMSTGNEAQWLTSRGFVAGEGGPGDFRVGFNDHHTQATLPGGTPFNWGSNAAAAQGGVGGTGADDPAFTQHYYRPMTSAPQVPTGPNGSPPTGTEQDPLTVQLPPSAQQGDSGGNELGQDFVGGIAEMFGFDGSVFKNPMNSGLFKGFKGLMSGLTKGGDGASSMAPTGAGGGPGGLLGSLLSFVPQAVTPGAPGAGADPSMPSMPDSGGINIPALATSGQTGAPGPGNSGDYSINFNGPVGNPQQAMDAAQQANIPRMRQGYRPLPS